jgi:hypothetical protein
VERETDRLVDFLLHCVVRGERLAARLRSLYRWGDRSLPGLAIGVGLLPWPFALYELARDQVFPFFVVPGLPLIVWGVALREFRRSPLADLKRLTCVMEGLLIVSMASAAYGALWLFFAGDWRVVGALYGLSIFCGTVLAIVFHSAKLPPLGANVVRLSERRRKSA